MVDRDKNYTGITDKERVSLVLRIAPTFLRYENEIDNKYIMKILGKKFPSPSRNRTHDLPVDLEGRGLIVCIYM